MTDAPTPGQVAYEAWWRVHVNLPGTNVSFGFARLRPNEQAAWEAAAQAVRAMQEEEETHG